MRIKRGITSHRRHKKLLESVKGYRMSKRRLIKSATEAHLHAGAYAYQGRKKKKSDFRKLWIIRITAAVRSEGISYSQFIHKMKLKKISLDRKILALLVREDPETFKAVVDRIRKN
ncbi:MAG: 50S ribosomal protein L20, large subunit ribosomal protein L20 [Candidatus Gottesmanbacteria bacterium GW2011_GWA2_43_14]|uniref:Large ribosomal subunit protein bL20 n=1 Tax=Candidatus Gottesmanbacteria bacterium GW2011_GWA2_43_14 TaxID=1618443 RepID=A0A0G1GHU3_9BACT|nr:MAG: 50S ribosomal protein L20, large subunit ribosomal protein L20 [Candidatus Gottesmanbacteria bacterium GW2011_GWA2_43_14]